jgi:CheY-like chemotaxis protein
MEKIYDPFFTTKKPGEGTGMGLSVVHGIFKSCHGAITVQSDVGKGTEFNVYFPLLIDIERDEKEANDLRIARGNERILFVDDEEELVNLGKEMLTGLGYQVIGRTSSLEALKLFRTLPDQFDLVITDMTMPNLTGVELAQELMLTRPDLPVILCTGFSETITPLKAKSLGVREFVMKPIALEQMALTIRRALDPKV